MQLSTYSKVSIKNLLIKKTAITASRAFSVSSILWVLTLSSDAFANVLNTNNLDYDKRCYSDIPVARTPEKDFSIDSTPVEVTADKVEATLKNDISYSGNVEIIQGHRTLKAKETTYNQDTQELKANGDIFYDDGAITVKSEDSLSTNLRTNQTVLKNASYHINGSLVRGYANEANLNSENKTISLTKAKATTCPINAEAWSVQSTTINIDQNEVFGEAYNTTFWFYDIPVLYLPYINFPIKNERKSGLLYPGVAYSNSDGYEIEVPIYWNIAPNYDYTFSPRIIQHRGVLFKNEFRYLPIEGTLGAIRAEFINHDKKADNNDNNNDINTVDEDETRWFFNVKHHTTFGNTGVNLDIDYSRIKTRDYNYINDFDSIEVSDNQLSQKINLSYQANHFESSIRSQYYQSLIPEGTVKLSPFRLLPEVLLNYHNVVPKFMSYRIGFNFSNFYLPEGDREQGFYGHRLHIQPEFEMPLINLEGISVTATGRYFYTYYNQNISSNLSPIFTNQGFSSEILENNASRSLFSGELYGRMRLEKKHENGFTSALTPELKYIYIPYRNQDHIGLYDTTDRLYDYTSLFNYSQFAGLDRISDSNRIAYGISYKIYDDDYRERIRFNIGQGYDFVKKRVKLHPKDENNAYPRTPIAGSINYNIVEGLDLHGDVIYNTRKQETTSWNTQLNMNYNEWSGQFGYRYTRDGNRTLRNEIIDLKQLGGTLEFPINEDIKAITAMYYDIEQSRNIDQKLAVRYESCCYNIGVQVERYNKPDNITLKAKEETTFGVFFEFKGLTSVGIASDFSKSTHLIPVSNTVNLSK